MPMHREIDRNFFKTWSPAMAYVLGLFAADGSMFKNRRGAHFLDFHSTDKSIIVTVHEAFKSNHKITPRKRSVEHKIIYRLQIGSKEVFSDLMALGFTPAKSKTLSFPKIPEEYFGDFVRGYFDGDGCVYFKKHWIEARRKRRWIFSSRFTSGSKKFLVSLLCHLRKKGVRGGFIVDKKRGYDLVLSHHDSVALYNIMYNNMPKCLYLKRKFFLFSKAINTLWGRSSIG